MEPLQVSYPCARQAVKVDVRTAQSKVGRRGRAVADHDKDALQFASPTHAFRITNANASDRKRREGLPFEALSPTLMPYYFMSHIPVMIQLYQSNSHSREIDWKDTLLCHASLARCPFPNRDIRDSSHGLTYLQLRFLSVSRSFLTT
jgi:hypothetical protein